MKRGLVFATVAIIVLISVMGCRSADNVVPPPTTENLSAERNRIQSDTNMPPAAKEAALNNLNRREQEVKK